MTVWRRVFKLLLSSSPSPKTKTAVYTVLAALFGLFALVFISVALLVIFWEDHRVFVSCCIAGAYLLLFLFFLGKVRNLAANMPYAFEESRQILAADVAAFRASCNKKAGVANQHPVDPTKEENNNAGK